MITSAFVHLFRQSGSPLDRELGARLGIDFGVAPATPGKKELQIEVHLVDGETLSDELIASISRCLKPVSMGAVHRFRVFDGPLQIGVFDFPEPRNIDALS